MNDPHRAYRQLERKLMLNKPGDSGDSEDQNRGERIATIWYDLEDGSGSIEYAENYGPGEELDG
jgi:hypothetical protein